MASVCEVCGKKPQLRHAPQPLAPAHEAALEPERAEGAGRRERHPEAPPRLHLLPQGRQGAEALTPGGPRCRASSAPTTRRPARASSSRDTDRAELVLAADALEGSLFRMLRQGQRVNFELDGDGRATGVRIGSEPDMGLPTAQV